MLCGDIEKFYNFELIGAVIHFEDDSCTSELLCDL